MAPGGRFALIGPTTRSDLERDLLDDLTLVKVWRDVGSNRGQMHYTGVASYKDGIEQAREIARRRA
jgi:hypothetical protein